MIFFILEPSVFIPRGGGHSRTFQLGGMKKHEKKTKKWGKKTWSGLNPYHSAHRTLTAVPCTGALQRHRAAAPAGQLHSAHTTPTAAPCSGRTSMPTPKRTHHSNSSTFKQALQRHTRCPLQSAHTTLTAAASSSSTAAALQRHPAAAPCSGTRMPTPKCTQHWQQRFQAAAPCSQRH